MDGENAKEVGCWCSHQHGSFFGPAEACHVVGPDGSCGFDHGALVSKYVVVRTYRRQGKVSSKPPGLVKPDVFCTISYISCCLFVISFEPSTIPVTLYFLPLRENQDEIVCSHQSVRYALS